MKFELDTTELYKNVPMELQKRSYDKRKARTIANNLLRDYAELPLAWDQLTGIEMMGIVDEEPIQIDLHFGIYVVTFAQVIVNETYLTIVGAGINGQTLVY